MTNFILEKQFKINHRNINCKVTGEPDFDRDGATFVLEINGGPGLCMNTRIFENLLQYSEDGIPTHHWILFDNLGCGDSDPAENPDEEYTPENFTHIAASIVENVFEELKLSHMNLRVEGGSFGGTIALNLPFHRPEWTQLDSPIKLQSIFAFIAPIGLKDCTSKEFTEAVYIDDPKLPQYLEAIDKLYTAKIKDREEYISTILVPFAPTYGDQYNTLFMRTCLSILKKNPYALYKSLNFLKLFKPSRMFGEKTFDFLYRFAFDVVCHFFRNRWHGFELEEKLNQHPEILEVYNKISIFVVYGATDLCTSGEKTLIRLRNVLPQIGSYLHPGKHHDNYDSIIPIMNCFLTGNTDKFQKVMCDNKIIKKNDVLDIPQTFHNQYMNVHHQK